MELTLVHSRNNSLDSKRDMTRSAPPSSEAWNPSETLWIVKMRRLRLNSPHLAKMIEDMTDNFIENGVRSDELGDTALGGSRNHAALSDGRASALNRSIK